MSNPEEFILPPEGDGHGSRYESADVDIEEVRKFIENTEYEEITDLIDLLEKKYDMDQRSTESHVEVGMTNFMRRPTTEETRRMFQGEIIDTDFDISPVSGEKPELVIHEVISTTSEEQFDLQIFKVFNRNNKFRYEYVLNKLS